MRKSAESNEEDEGKNVGSKSFTSHLCGNLVSGLPPAASIDFSFLVCYK